MKESTRKPSCLLDTKLPVEQKALFFVLLLLFENASARNLSSEHYT